MKRMAPYAIARRARQPDCQARKVALPPFVPGTDHLRVFRITGTATFMAYNLGYISEPVWFARPWKSYGISAFDSLVYAGVTGGIFGWLWI
jgi:hypothetical protein